MSKYGRDFDIDARIGGDGDGDGDGERDGDGDGDGDGAGAAGVGDGEGSIQMIEKNKKKTDERYEDVTVERGLPWGINFQDISLGKSLLRGECLRPQTPVWRLAQADKG